MQLPLTPLCDHGHVTARRRPRAQRRARRARPAPSSPPTATPPAATPASPLAAESLLLDLARTLPKREVTDAAEFTAAVDITAAAYAPDAPLARALHADWLHTTDDKTARLALGWAREQVRLALVDILQRARAARVVRGHRDAETAAWLWLAACEALAHDPASAVPDRVHALVTFLTAP